MFWKNKIKSPSRAKPRPPLFIPDPPKNEPFFDQKLWEEWKNEYVKCSWYDDDTKRWITKMMDYGSWLRYLAYCEKEKKLNEQEYVDAMRYIKGDSEYKAPRNPLSIHQVNDNVK